MPVQYTNSSQPSSNSGYRNKGFPPPPKSVRTWPVPGAEESEPEKSGLATAGKTADQIPSVRLKWLFARDFAWLWMVLLLIALVCVVVKQVMR